jgi:hypothetical protein
MSRATLPPKLAKAPIAANTGSSRLIKAQQAKEIDRLIRIPRTVVTLNIVNTPDKK